MISISRMRYLLVRTVKLLTFTSVVALSGCAYLHSQFQEQCNSRAYIEKDFDEFVTARFPSGAPLRMAVIPFSVPANLSTHTPEFPGLDRQLAERVHGELADSQRIPVVEVLNRQDWPGKKEEFFTGNFGAIAQAREAGYDIVFIGYLERSKSLDTLSAYSKVIEVESGITLFYGRSEVHSNRQASQDARARLGFDSYRSDKVFDQEMIDSLSRCMVKKFLDDK